MHAPAPADNEQNAYVLPGAEAMTAFRQSGSTSQVDWIVHVVEVSLELSPTPFSGQQKEQEEAQDLLSEIQQAVDGQSPRLLDLSCEKDDQKRVCGLSSEILTLQLYDEKSAVGSGARRPGSGLDS